MSGDKLFAERSIMLLLLDSFNQVDDNTKAKTYELRSKLGMVDKGDIQVKMHCARDARMFILGDYFKNDELIRTGLPFFGLYDLAVGTPPGKLMDELPKIWDRCDADARESKRYKLMMNTIMSHEHFANDSRRKALEGHKPTWNKTQLAKARESKGRSQR